MTLTSLCGRERVELFWNLEWLSGVLSVMFGVSLNLTGADRDLGDLIEFKV